MFEAVISLVGVYAILCLGCKLQYICKNAYTEKGYTRFYGRGLLQDLLSNLVKSKGLDNLQ